MGDKVLIIAPHPDDETLGTAGTIQHSLQTGKQVKVVFMTVGDGYYEAVKGNFGIESPTPADYRRLGEVRHSEAIAALKQLGLDQQNLIFLGYPDGGVDHLWQSNWDYSRVYKGINGCTYSPYRFSYQQQADYCGANVVGNLANILRAYNPTDVIFPDPHDQHNDHWATSAFVKYTLNEQKFTGEQWTYIIHKGNYPVPWHYAPELPLAPPISMAGLAVQWVEVPLNDKQKARKLAAIEQYKTQTRLVGGFFKEFVRKNELLGVYRDPVLQRHTVFGDAADDLKLKKAGPAADITAVGVECTNGELRLDVKTVATVSQQLTYNLRLRIFRPHGVARLDIKFHGGQLLADQLAGNSLGLPATVRWEAAGNRLRVTLPAEITADAESVMLAADSYVGDVLADVTPWRLLFLFG